MMCKRIIKINMMIAIYSTQRHTRLFAISTNRLTQRPFNEDNGRTMIILMLLQRLINAITRMNRSFRSRLLNFTEFTIVFSRRYRRAFYRPSRASSRYSLISSKDGHVIQFRLLTTCPRNERRWQRLLNRNNLLGLRTLIRLTYNRFRRAVRLNGRPNSTLFFIFSIRTLGTRASSISNERESITTSSKNLQSRAIFRCANATSRNNGFVLMTFQIVNFPILTLIRNNIRIRRIQRRAPYHRLTNRLMRIMITIFERMTRAPFLFPCLSKRSNNFSISCPLVNTFRRLTSSTTPLNENIYTMISKTRRRLITTT